MDRLDIKDYTHPFSGAGNKYYIPDAPKVDMKFILSLFQDMNAQEVVVKQAVGLANGLPGIMERKGFKLSLSNLGYRLRLPSNSKIKLPRGHTITFAEARPDNVNHPSHYTSGKIEVIDFIEDQKLDMHTGNAVKYIARAGKKDPSKEVEDLEKAIWYLRRKIQVLGKTSVQ